MRVVFVIAVFLAVSTINPIIEQVFFDAGVKTIRVENPTLPSSPTREPVRSQRITVTFYSSTPDQTDDTPFITANGTQVRYGIAAANFLPFGTRIKLPELFGDEVFVVHDRMNPRFSRRVDIWLKSREEAIDHGVYYTTVEMF